MIGFLKGIVQNIDLKKIIILTEGGVGYEIFASLNLLGNISEGKSTEAYIHTIVREQEISLYGFATLDEKKVFEKLIGISGIGPKIGLTIVSGDTNQFLDAVENGDIPIITQTPGIGKKMAQKIILELKGKLDLSSTPKSSLTPAKQEAVDALMGLGYDRKTINDVLASATPSADTETFIKYFLKNLCKNTTRHKI